MNQILRKGWCPTLERPMETGDGLLVRLHIRYGIVSAANALVIADCSTRYGNGLIDLTSRGNLQFRGVKHKEYEALFTELTQHGFTQEPRPERSLYPDYLPSLGYLPVDVDRGTIGLGLAFGRLDAAMLKWLAEVAQHYGTGALCLSPWRAVYITQVKKAEALRVIETAKDKGFITDSHDSLRMIQTCSGAPACSSALGPTRELAFALARTLPDLLDAKHTIHVSGCAKGCACPQKSSAVIVAQPEGYDIAWNETASASPDHIALSAENILNTVRSAL